MGLSHSGEGLVGGHCHHVRPPEGGQAQEGQVGPVGAVYEKFSTVGVDDPGDGPDIR